MSFLTQLPLPLVYLISFAALAAAAEFGRALGMRRSPNSNVSTLEASILGLLALLLGFCFATAMSRHEERRAAVLSEANAIGTAALRASLLPAPHDWNALKAMKEYTQLRVSLIGRPADGREFNAALGRSNSLQSDLWRDVKGALEKNNAMAPVGIYIQSLNDMFDSQEKRLVAARSHVPDFVMLSLYAITIISIGFSAYARGVESKTPRGPVYVTAMLIAGVILLIQDIDRPDVGMVSVNQTPMIDTAGQIDGLLKSATPN